MAKISAKHFDLDRAQLAYQLGGEDIIWISKKCTKRDEFDEDKWWDDFDNWWDSLDEYEQNRIWDMMR